MESYKETAQRHNQARRIATWRRNWDWMAEDRSKSWTKNQCNIKTAVEGRQEAGRDAIASYKTVPHRVEGSRGRLLKISHHLVGVPSRNQTLGRQNSLLFCAVGSSNVWLFHQIFRWQLSERVQRRIGGFRTVGRKTWPLTQVDFWEQGVKSKERDIHKMILALALGSFSKTLRGWRPLCCELSLYALQLPSASHWQHCQHHSYSRLIQFTQNPLWCQLLLSSAELSRLGCDLKQRACELLWGLPAPPWGGSAGSTISVNLHHLQLSQGRGKGRLKGWWHCWWQYFYRGISLQEQPDKPEQTCWQYLCLFKDFLSEDTPVGMSFLRVAAHDSDQGVNAAVTYSMLEHQLEYFQINPSTGWVYVNCPLPQVMWDSNPSNPLQRVNCNLLVCTKQFSSILCLCLAGNAH